MPRSDAATWDSIGRRLGGSSASRRGRYDRSASASERARSQRTRLLDAVREVVLRAQGPLTVSMLSEHVGCGRNTFYEHFDDVEAAIKAACRESLDLLDVMIREAIHRDIPRTPTDVAVEIASAWGEWCARDKRSHWTVLERFSGHSMNAVLGAAATHVHQCLVAVGGASSELELERADAVAGALGAIARGVFLRHTDGSEHAAERVVRASRDALLRLLR